eukprot:scaffold22504_cov32-Tisochrysis_lutea.AAC.3
MMLEKATVPYAGASVLVAWPTQRSATTGITARSSAMLSLGTCRTATHSRLPSGARSPMGSGSGERPRMRPRVETVLVAKVEDDVKCPPEQDVDGDLELGGTRVKCGRRRLARRPKVPPRAPRLAQPALGALW